MPNIYDDITNPQGAKEQGELMGQLIAEGIGVGLDENSYDAITATEGVYVKLENVTKNAAKNAENLAKKRQQRELDNLKNSLKLGLLTEQEYYTKLKEYRDTHIAQGTEAWFKCTEEIALYNKKLIDNAAAVRESYQEMMEDVEKVNEDFQRMVDQSVEKTQKLKESLRDKVLAELATDTPLVDKQKITIINGGEKGEALVYNKAEPSNFQGDIDGLERYRKVMDELMKLGDLPKGILAQISNMNFAEATETAQIILNATPEKRKKFFDGFNLRESLKMQFAEELYPVFYGEELQKAAEESAEAFKKGVLENDTFTEVLEKAFGEVPESYYQLGEASAKAFEGGFESQLEGIMTDLRNQIFSVLNQQPTASAPYGTLGDASGSTSNVFNTSYTFNASKDTTTTQLAAAKNAATLERLRGGIY